MIIEIVLKIVDFLSSVGFVHKDNLVGKAQFIFFSTNIREGSVFEFWNWKKILELKDFLKKLFND